MAKKLRFFIIPIVIVIVAVLVTAGVTILRTLNRTIIQFYIKQDREIIQLSTYAEPPQFAIWIENTRSKHIQTVFVTGRVSHGDWEGKADVPVALPMWNHLFQVSGSAVRVNSGDEVLAVTGATPQDDYFSVRVEVKPGTEWTCWIEMNLAGDYNEAFPEFNPITLVEDEFACGQPALLYRTEIVAEEGFTVVPELFAQSVWSNGENITEPVSNGVTTAKEVFSEIMISISRPKPKFINKNKIKSNFYD